MIGATGRWEGLDGLSESLLAELRPEAEHRVKRALVHFANELKITLTGARSGRTYKVSKTGRLHVASAPGEPPAVLFGALRNSVGHSEPEWDGWTIAGEVGIGLGKPPAGDRPDPETSYGPRLEFGGIDSRGIRILPRPYMEPTAVRVEPQIEAILEGGA